MTAEPARPIVWSYGGGTQTAAIAVLILTGRLPRPDMILMADTGREVQATWDYLHGTVEPDLNKIGLAVTIIPHTYAYHDIVKGNNNAVLIPAYTTQNGSIGKMPTFCSNEWKQRPIRRYLKEQGIDACDLWLGISMDEIERMKQSDVKWQRNVYPLIEMIPLYRHQCISTVENYGWATPPKSRCFICPNMNARSWQEMKKQYPGDFEKAVSLEIELHEIDPNLFLHALAVPLPEAVERTDRQPDLFDNCDSGFCFT